MDRQQYDKLARGLQRDSHMVDITPRPNQSEVRFVSIMQADHAINEPPSRLLNTLHWMGVLYDPEDTEAAMYRHDELALRPLGISDVNGRAAITFESMNAEAPIRPERS